MTGLFHYSLLNDPFGDPVLAVRIHRDNRILLFDAGNLAGLSPRSLLRVSDVFISHTHMDHFMDIDRVVRVKLMHDSELRIYGPQGITEQVRSKFKAYRWNVSNDYPLRISVVEVGDSTITESVMLVCDGFERVALRGTKSTLDDAQGAEIRVEDEFTVRALVHDHGIPCLAFKVIQAKRLGVNPVILHNRGFIIGDWIAQLRKKVRRQELSDYLEVPTRSGVVCRAINDLCDLLVDLGPGLVLGYVVDAAPTEANVARLATFFTGTDVLHCETAFVQDDFEHALRKKHLTAGLAKLLAEQAGNAKLIPCHVSPRNEGQLVKVFAEAGVASK